MVVGAVVAGFGALGSLAYAGDGSPATTPTLLEPSPAQVAEISECFDDCTGMSGLSDLDVDERTIRCAVSCEIALQSADELAIRESDLDAPLLRIHQLSALCVSAGIYAGAYAFLDKCFDDIQRYDALAANPNAGILDRFMTWWKSEETPTTWAKWAALGGFPLANGRSRYEIRELFGDHWPDLLQGTRKHRSVTD